MLVIQHGSSGNILNCRFNTKIPAIQIEQSMTVWNRLPLFSRKSFGRREKDRSQTKRFLCLPARHIPSFGVGALQSIWAPKRCWCSYSDAFRVIVELWLTRSRHLSSSFYSWQIGIAGYSHSFKVNRQVLLCTPHGCEKTCVRILHGSCGTEHCFLCICEEYIKVGIVGESWERVHEILY